MNSKNFNIKEQEIYNKYKQITDSINESKHNYALKEINKLYYKSIEIGFSEGVTLYYENYFYIAFYTHDNHLALAINQLLIYIYIKENNIQRLKHFYTTLGAILTRLSDFKSSTYYLKKSLQINLENFEATVLVVSITYVTLAFNCIQTKDFELANKYINRGLMNYEPFQIPEKENTRLVYLYLYKLRTLLHLDEIDKAYALFNTIFKDELPLNIKEKNGRDTIYIELMLKKREHNEDLDLLSLINKLFNKSIENNEKELTIGVLGFLKEYHIQNKNFKLAYKYANHIIEETDKLQFKQINVINRNNQLTPIKNISEENSEYEIYLKSELKDVALYQNQFHKNNKINSNNLKIDSYFKAHKTLSGDYIGSFILGKKNKLHLIIVADVSGKGITASYISFMIDGILKSIVNSTNTINLKKIVLDINSILSDSLNNLGFVSMWAGLINLNTNEIESINAGHPPPYLVNKGKKIKELIKGSYILGAFKDLNNLESEISSFNKGDFIIAYTDGITEAMNDSEEMFEEKFELLIHNYTKNSKGNFISLLKNELTKKNYQTHDDTSCLHIEYTN